MEQTGSVTLEESINVVKEENASQAEAAIAPASQQNKQMTREQYRQSHES